MHNNKSFKIPRFVFILLVMGLATAICILFMFDLVIFTIDRFSPYNLSCKVTNGNIFNEMECKNVRFGSRSNSHGEGPDFQINVQNVKLKLDGKSLFTRGRIELDCLLEETLFESAPGDVLSAGANDVLAASFDGKREYEVIKFKLLLDKKLVKISGFVAESEDIKVSGDYAYFKRQKDVRMNVKVAFSPKIISTFKDDFITKNMLSVDPDGWYSTMIEYNGNPELLKAISQIIIPPATS